MIRDYGIQFLVVTAEFLASKHPIGLAIVTVKDGLGLLVGIGDKYESKFQLYTASSLAGAYCRLFPGFVFEQEPRYLANESEEALARSCLADVAQCRMLGDAKCFGFCKDGGLLGILVFGESNAELLQRFDRRIDLTLSHAFSALGFPIEKDVALS